MPATHPGTALAGFSGPVTLSSSRQKGLGLLAGALAFGLLGAFILAPGPTGLRAQIAGWAALAFGVAGILVCIAMLMPGGAGLTLAADGFGVTRFFHTRHTPWILTSEFTIQEVATGHLGYRRRLVVYERINQAGAVAAFNRATLGRSTGLPDNYGLPHEELAWMMNRWRERALAQTLRRFTAERR